MSYHIRTTATCFPIFKMKAYILVVTCQVTVDLYLLIRTSNCVIFLFQIVCHLPYGPTAFFQMSDVIMRHDVPDMAPMSEQYPHLLFHNFKTDLGQRTVNILKYLFPVPKEDSKRVITFANHDDYICFRHHTYKKVIIFIYLHTTILNI